MTDDDKLGPMPDPVVEPPEANPGGADAINEETPFAGDDHLGKDLHPDANPGVEDQLPDEIGQTDDKSQAPREGAQDDADAEDPE
ncbi:MAG TPA: hypothetical protein VD814_10135 [Nocardioides sp.]|nr:hypothetical protein [Nocardioides sp.]